MAMQALMTAFFGLPPTKTDNTAFAAKYFIDAKEAY
jgi:hypothetical protein